MLKSRWTIPLLRLPCRHATFLVSLLSLLTSVLNSHLNRRPRRKRSRAVVRFSWRIDCSGYSFASPKSRAFSMVNGPPTACVWSSARFAQTAIFGGGHDSKRRSVRGVFAFGGMRGGRLRGRSRRNGGPLNNLDRTVPTTCRDNFVRHAFHSAETRVAEGTRLGTAAAPASSNASPIRLLKFTAPARR